MMDEWIVYMNVGTASMYLSLYALTNHIPTITLHYELNMHYLSFLAVGGLSIWAINSGQQFISVSNLMQNDVQPLRIVQS